MNRRAVLAGAVTAVTGLAGCLAADGGAGGGDDGGAGDGGDTTGGGSGGDGTDSGTSDDDTGEADSSSGDCDDGDDCGPPSVTDTDVATTDTGCGTHGADETTVTLDGRTLTIEGVLWASTPCHDAVLDGVDVQDGELRVQVGVERRDGVCVECIGEIEYRVTVDVTNVYGLDRVRVSHEEAGEHAFSMDEIAEGS